MRAARTQSLGIPFDHAHRGGRRRRRSFFTAAAAIVVLSACLGLSGAIAAPAVTYLVDDTVDRVDASIGSNGCRTSANTCSLRAAIQEANAHPGADVIYILPGTYSIGLAPVNENAANVGDFELLDPVRIEKAPGYLGDVIIDGGNPLPGSNVTSRGVDRIFEIHPGAGDVTLRNLTLQNGFSPEEGGAIQNWSLGKLTLDGVTVKDSYAEKAGGGLNHADLNDYEWAVEPENLALLPFGRVEIKNSTFTGNGAGDGGAAINNVSGGTITITGSLVTLNPGPIKPDPLDPEEFVLVDPSDYPLDASAISNQARWEAVGTIRIVDSEISKNASESSGAGISSWGDSIVNIEDSTVTGNRTGAEGGGLFTEGGKVTVTNTEVSKNQAASGGGLYSGGHPSTYGLRGRFEVTDSRIFENKAESGGGIYNDGDAQLLVTDTTFTKNFTSDHGAAIATSGRSNLTLTRVEVTENESWGEGGGVWTHSERQQTIVDSLFQDNHAGVPHLEEDGLMSDDVAGGGGLHSDGGPTTILRTTFDGNTATEEGGGLSINNLGDFLMRDSVVSNNRAADGGGLENSAHRVTFERVTVLRNHAKGAGGGIYNTSSDEFHLTDSTIRENVGVIGGGVANAPDNSIIVRGSLFLSNSARIAMTEEGEIDENAGKGGGLMSFADGDSLIENSTFSGNKAAGAGGGLFHDADGELRLHHVTIWRNSAPVGGGIGVKESDFVPEVPPKTNAAVVLKNSIVGGSLNGGSCDWYVRSEGGNLETGDKNACFLAVTAETAQSPIELGVRDRRGDAQLWAIADNGGPTMTHALQWGSLAIDSSNLPCAIEDQRGVERPQNGRCDAGAFEFQGMPPIFDNTPPETIFNPATDRPRQDSFETMAWTFRGTDDLTAAHELNFECRLIEVDLAEQQEPVAPWDPVPPELMWNGCSSPWSTPLMEEGLMTFEVRAIDRAGNIDPTPVSYILTGDDMLPPDTKILEKPPLQTNSRSALFSFTGVSDFTPAQFMEYECRLDSRDPDAWLECFNPAMYSNLSTGLHTFEVRAIAGEIGAFEGDPTPARYTWRVGPNPDVPTDTPLDCNQANITITATADGWADQVNPLENYMFETELDVRSDANVPGDGQPIVPMNARAFFRFPIQNDAPSCELESATLRLYSSGHTEGRVLEAVPLEDAWKESQLTWITQPDPYPGAAAATADAGELYREWDVKAHVEAILAGDLPNNGWVIRDQHENDADEGGDQTFVSREQPQDPPEVTLPELELRFEAAGAPPTPPRDQTLVDKAVGCGELITESTRLTADVTGCLTEGIAIGAPNIILDLNGHKVESGLVLEPGEEDILLPGIRSGYPNVEIRNGVVTNYGYGVLLGPGSTGSLVHNLTLYRNALGGVQLFDADDGRTGATVRDSRFDSNGETGLQIFAGTEGSTVENNYFVSNGMSIHVDASHRNLIRDNEVSGIILDPELDSDAGIVVENGSRLNVLEGNDVSDTGDAGIVVHQGSHGTKVTGGVLVRNGDAGVIAEDSDRIEIDGVLSHGQSDGGVVIGNSTGSTVKNSDLRYNPTGIDASNTNGLVVAGNDASNSLQAGLELGNGLGMQVTNNVANRTGGSGISLEGGAFDSLGVAHGGSLIADNTTNENAEAGISVAEPARHTLARNTANNNAGYGIEAGEEPSPGEPIDPNANIDGGGNRASGNHADLPVAVGLPGLVQCLGVVCADGDQLPITAADLSAPQTIITNGPLGPPPAPADGTTGNESAAFTFTGDDGPLGTPPTALTFECRLDAPPDPVVPEEPELEPPDPLDPELPEPPEGELWVECVSPHTYLSLEPGEHRLEVRAVDVHDNFDLTPAEYVWTIHAGVDDEGQSESPPVSPETRITAAPGEMTELRTAQGEPLLDEHGQPVVFLGTVNRAATLRFTGSDNLTAGYNLSYECRSYYEELNDSLTPADMPSEAELPFEPCAAPEQYTNLGYGGHIFEVRSVDLAGNRDVTPAWHAWWIHPPPPDVTPPDTTIASGPDLTTVATTAIFAFTGSDNQTPLEELAFECRLDGAMEAGEPLWQSCSSPYQVVVSNPAALTEHVLQVRAVDQSGNFDDVNGTVGDALPDGVPAAYVWKVGPAPVPKTVFCGQKITQSIVVNNSLGDCLGHGLIVGADGITIDLNGKTIDGKALGAAILNNGFDSVTVKNGTLIDYDYGVMLNNGAELNVVEGVTVHQTQDAAVGIGHPTQSEDPNFPLTQEPLPGFLSGADGNILRSNTFVGNTRGVWLLNGAKDNLVRGNLVGASSDEAVWIDRAHENLVEGNDIEVASKGGVLIEGAEDNTVRDNAITSAGSGVIIEATTSGTIGIESLGNVVQGNVVTDSSGPAVEIESSSSNRIIDNVGTLTDSYAIDLYQAHDNVIRGNEVGGNKGGIYLKQSIGNLIEENETSDSDSTGIVLESQSFSNVVRANTSSNNDGGGIYIGDETPAGQGTLVEGNTTNSNKGEGIKASKPSHIFKDNIAFDNDTWGIHVGDPSGGRANVDGGGNLAQGNQGPLGIDLKPQQCYGIRCEGGPGGGDQIAPNTSLLEAPHDPSTESLAVFRFTGADNQSPIVFECRFESTLESEWLPCESPKTYGDLVNGEYTFEVRARDFSGNVDPTPAVHTWHVALGGFSASLDATPDRVTVETSATFEFSANRQSNVTFQCVLQPAVPATPVDWSSAPTCASPKTYTGLEPGQYEFWVRATDVASSYDTKRYTWTVGPAPVAAEVNCGQIITQSTRVLNDLVDCGGYALIVGAPGITIDLDGHVVDGLGLDAGILNNGHDDVTITGGLIDQFLYGVQLNPGTARNVVHSMRFEANEEAAIALSDADQGGDGNTIRDNSIVGNEIGIALYAGTRHAVIRDNNLAANAGEGGIVLEFVSDNLIERNQIGMSGGAGVYALGGGGNTITDNTIRESGAYGISAGDDLLASNDNLIQRNTIRGGGGGILVAGDGNRVVNNSVSAATGPGVSVEVATDTLVRGNDFGGNAGGVAVSEASGTVIEANNASGTLGAGIEVGELSTDTVVRDNTTSGNGGAGIEVSDSSALNDGTLIEGNTADANGDDGIYVEGAGHVIRSNVAQLNGSWGIYSVGAVDGGGNVAAGNMEVEQCFGVNCALGAVPGAPDTWVVAGPADTNPALPGVQSVSRNASFTYMGEDEFNAIHELVFECRIDSTSPTAWEDCEYPAEYLNLSPGPHTFEVRAIDMLGQGLADPTPARFTWTYAPLPFGVAPTVTIDHKPPAETFLLDAVFTFHANEPDVSFQCKVDQNGWQPCGFEGADFMSQGAFEWGLEETEVGPHTFYVRAVDFEGNVGQPATYTWRLLGVTVAFTDGPGFVPASGGPQGDPATGGPSASPSAEIHFEANVADATFWCRFDSLDPGDYFPCESPFRVGPAHLGNTEFPDALLLGDHVLEVFAESETMGSAAELEPAVYEWEVLEYDDTMPPETTLERAPGPADPSSTIFEFSGTDDLTPPFLLTFECQVTAGTAPPNENDWVECVSPFNLLDVYSYADPQLLLTQHTFYVRATDMFEPEFPNPQQPDFEGNPDPTPAFHTWTPVADTRGPSVTISGGPANGATVGEEAEPYTFFGLDNATPVLELEFECAAYLTAAGIGSAEWESCDSPVGGGYEINGLEPGAYTVAVRAVDLAGNVGVPATRAVTVAAAPVVTILSGPAGRIHPETGVPSLPPSTTEHAVFTFRADQPGATFECSLDGSDFVPCNAASGTTPGVFVHAFWVVESDEHEVAIRATNPQLLVGEEAVYEWVVALGPDVVPPNTSFGTGPQNGTQLLEAAFTFTGLDNRTPTLDLEFECALDSTTSWSSCTSPEQLSDLTRGTHTYRVRAIDAAGNIDPTPAAYTWTVSPPPVATITDGPGVEEEETTSRTATFEFSSDAPGSTFHCWLDGKFNPAQPGNPAQPAPCASGVTYENLGLGEHLFAVRAVDAFGNIGVWEDVEFLVTPPEARITSAPASGTTTTATFQFTSEPFDANAEFYCALDDRPFGLCESPKTYTNLWPGEHTFQVQTVYTGVDWMGEPLELDPVPVRHTWTVTDFTAPETTIDFGPPATTISTSAYLGVSSDDPTATFLCRLNGSQEECEPGVPIEFTDLTPGAYTFTAQAIDPLGNEDPTPATRSWTIGTPAGPPNTPVGDSVLVTLPQAGAPGSATVNFFTVDTAGYTTVDLIGGGPPLPEGYGGASGAVYDISTTAEFGEPVVVCLSYDPDAYGTPSVRLLHFDGELWLDITTLNNPFSSPARVCGEAESFSLFAVAAASGGMMPETSILSGPDGPLGPEGLPTSTSGFATFEFWVDQPNAIAQCSIDGEPFVFCESPFTVGPVGEGDHEFIVQGINEFGWTDLTPAIYEWEVVGPDTTPPSTVITKGPPPNSSTPNFISIFEFSGSDDFTPLLELEFECELDGEDLGGCETPEEIEAETPGLHTLVVRAVDEAGNVDPVGASRTWRIVDLSPPDTEVIEGPEEETTETSATFTFEGFEELNDLPVNEFECALDTGDFAPCTSPHTIPGPLGAGLHVFHVRAVDPDGNVDISPAFYEWLIIGGVDDVPPDTFLPFHPDPLNSGPDVVFAFASDEPVESFECSWGDGTPPAAPTGWEECEPVWFLEGLDSGAHWLWVRAIDAAEPPNVDPTPAPGVLPFVWVTTGEPDTVITSAPSDPSGDFSAPFVFESDQPGATFQCSVDGSPWTPCSSSPAAPYIAGPFLPEENGEGSEHTFEVRAVNQYRNSDGEQVMDESPAEYEWRVQDDTPPETEFLGATPIGPEQFLEPGLRFSFRGDDDWASSFELEFECAFDNTADSEPAVWEECGEPGPDDSFVHELELAELEAGPYTFRVRAVDLAGNTDATGAPVPPYQFAVEAEPETTIGTVSPDMGVDLQTDATSMTFTFSGTGTSFECALDSTLFTPCSSPKTFTGVPYGEHLFRVQAVAPLGTRDQTPAEFEWASGFLTPPDVTITSAPALPTTSTSAAFEFESSDPDAAFLCTLDGVGPTPCESGVSYAGLLAGEQNAHTFEVVATKANLLVDGEPALFEWTIADATAPETTLLPPLPLDPSANAAEFAFTGTDNGTLTENLEYECRLDAEPFEPCSPPWQLSDLTGGEHTFEVRAVDEVPLADTSPASHTWSVIAPPLTQITAFPAEESTSQSATFEFFDQPGSTYECRLDPVEDPVPTPFAPCASPVFYTGLTNGPHAFEVRATTLPLNGLVTFEDPPASYEWEIDAPDAIAPETSIDLAVAEGATTTSRTASFLFGASDNLTAPVDLTYQCSLDGAPFEDCDSGIEYLDLAVGPHTFEVFATDVDENVDTTPATRSWIVAAAAANTPVGDGVEVGLAGGASVTFTTVTSAGVTSVTRLAGSPSLPLPYSGAGAIYFDVSTTAVYVGDLTVCLPYDTGSLDEPHLIHADDGEWVDVTTSLDAANGIVCGAVGSVSPFGIAEAPGLSPETEIAQVPEEPVLETEPGLAAIQFQFSSNDVLADFECSLDGEEWSSCSTPYEVDSHLGGHTLLVRALAETGAFDLTPASHSWTVLARPVATIVLGPEDQAPEDADIQNESRTATFWFGSDQPPSSFECRLTGENTGTTWEPCTSPATYGGLALEEYTFEVQALNAAGHASLLPAQFEWEVADLTRPSTTIASGPADPTSSRSATFVFSADEPATFECSLDGAPLSSCASDYTLTNLEPGPHAFEVLATDLSERENVELEPAVWTWTIDAEAPTVTLLETPPAADTATSATFSFGAGDNLSSSVTFECRLDGAGWESCASPQGYGGLEPGDHLFEVRAADEAGNTASASHGWEILDTTDPDTEITDVLPGSVIIHFTGTDDHSLTGALTFECRLDSDPFAACTSPKIYENTELSVGEHTFEVRAVDEAGNVDATPELHTWTVLDTTAPETVITGQPESSTAETGATFVFGGSDDSTAASGLAFQCSLDGAAFAACTSPVSYSGLAVGSHTFRVRAADAAGNDDATPAAYTWTIVDVAAPETAITSQPEASTAATAATFSFTGSDNATAAAGLTFACALDGAAFGACTSPRSYTGLAVGSHTFRVRATDVAGNVDATPAAYSWTVLDATAPETTITAQPPASTGSTAAVFEFTGSDAVTPSTSLAFECSLDGAAFGACTSPRSYTGLAVGSHTFRVRATDAAGNTDATPAAFTWTVLDTVAPETTITGHPAASTTSTTASFTFNGSDETTAAASLTFQCSLNGAPFAACASPRAYSGVPAGPHTFRVRASDAAGNVDGTPASFSWTVLDSTAPITSITGQPVATTTSTSATFAFTGGDDLTAPANLSFQCALDAGGFASCTSPRSYTGLAVGSHTFRVRATDAAGNTDATPAEYTWLVEPPADTTAPETTITGEPPATTQLPTAGFHFTSSETPATFECSLDSVTFAACTSPASYSGLAVGQHTFRVRARDAAGNTDGTPASVTWTVTPPSIDCGPQQTLSANADAWIDQGSASSNKGSDSILKVMSKSGSNLRGLVRFNLPALPQGCSVESATLRLFASSSRTGRTIQVLRLAGTWAEGGVTWGNQPATAGTAVTVSSGTGWREWGVAGLVQAMYTGGNNGFLVRDASESQDAEQQYHSREKGSEAPQLVLRLGNGAPPPPPGGSASPETSITGNPLAATSSAAATFTFTGVDDATPAAGLTFQCQLDVAETAAWTACTSPRAYTGLAQGAHTFRVRARDAAGNADPTPAVYTWTVDQTAPETVISGGGPGASTTSTSASFSFTSPESGVTFQCALDTTQFAACTSPASYSNLAVGPHTFQVRAVDAAGNLDGSPAPYTWTIQGGGGGVNCGAAQALPAAADAWIEQSSPSSNKGSDSILKLMSKSGSNLRALLRFDLPSIPAGCVLDAATLRVYAGSTSSSQRTLQVLRLGGSWTEGGVTWGNAPATTGSAVTTTSGTGYRQWNVAAIVQAMYSSGSNNGFLVRDATENQDAEQQFYSREKGESPPQLVLTFRPS
jgi:parallel beta-helix repeat protein